MSGILMVAFRKALVLGIFASLFCIGRSEAAVANLLVNGDFTGGKTGWGGIFEGAYVVDITDPNEADKQDWCPAPNGGYKRYLLFKGWYETNSVTRLWAPATASYPGAGQFVSITASNLAAHGRFLTASFNAKFDLDYKADKTVLTLKHADWANTNTNNIMLQKDFTDEINANRGKFHTYKAVYLRPTNLSLLGVGLVFQSYNFQCSETSPRTAIIDKITLSQQQGSEVGPQLSVKIVGLEQTNNNTNSFASPLVGKSTYYSLQIENQGGENLGITSVKLTNSTGTGFTLSGATATTLAPGATQNCSIIANPSTAGVMSGTLEIKSNDRDTSDQTFVINLSARAVNLNDDFTSNTPAELGWVTESYNVATNSTTSISSGSLVMNVNVEPDTYPWRYQVSKTFASPGTLNTAALSLLAELRASGVYSGGNENKVEARLESLNASKEFATGSLQLGQSVDETTSGSVPGSGAYLTKDGINDRVVLLVPEGGNFTQVGGLLASNAINTAFDPYAPYFRIVVKMTDFDFDVGPNKKVELNYLNLDLATQGFNLSNGGFEDGSYSPPTTDPQYYWAGINIEGWNKFPTEGVAKAVVGNGDAVYNSTGSSNSVVFSAFAGTKAMKVYGQNYYNSSGVWVGPSQTGTVYQEYLPSRTPGLNTGTVIHARGMAMMFSIDPLTGGSTFSYGFKFMDSANAEISRAVITFNSANFTADKWLPLTVNATIPEGTQKIQLISEFIQNASSDKGAVYLDDLSIGFGSINATATVGSATYPLAWSDEFDGSALNAANWTPELGTGDNGWGNGEQQSYTSNSDNLSVANGSLLIQAKKTGASWTSARIKSQGLRSFKYGKIEFRAKLPTGRGPWPAAWLLGTNISSVSWPNCGEIDVMEWRAGYGGSTNDVNTVGHALHSALRSGASPVEPPSRSTVTNPSSAFHSYAVLWNSNNLIFSVDGVDKATLTPPPGDADAFRQEFFLIMNLAMGGNYVGGYIDPSLTEARYEVDYVRVYQSSSASVTSDITPPAITLLGSNPASVNWGATYSDAGATAFDAGDNTSVTVLANNPVNTAVPGSYLMTYTATDSRSNTATTNRTVKVSMSNGGTNRGTDGLSDALRYAYGGTGTNPISTSLLPSNSIISSNLVLTYFARTNSNVTLTPVVSTDLSATNSWTNSGVSVSTLSTTTTNGTVLEKRQATTPVSGPKKFLKLNVLFTNP